MIRVEAERMNRVGRDPVVGEVGTGEGNVEDIVQRQVVLADDKGGVSEVCFESVGRAMVFGRAWRIGPVR